MQILTIKTKRFILHSYAHVGLITEADGPGSWQYVTGNWGTADSRTEMTRVGTSDIWQLTFSPSLLEWAEENNNNNASLPADIVVNEIALVFRNASGSLEGKTDDGSDIFVPVFSGQQGLISGFAVPTEYSSILEQGEELEVLVNASQEANIQLLSIFYQCCLSSFFAACLASFKRNTYKINCLFYLI